MVKAQTVGEAGGGSISAREDRHSRAAERSDSGLGICELGFRAKARWYFHVERLPHRGRDIGNHVGTVLPPGLVGRGGAECFDNGQCRNDKYVMLGGKFGKVSLRRRIGK